MSAAGDAIALPRTLAVALYGAAQSRPDRVVRGRVLRTAAGLGLVPEGAAAEGEGFAAFRSQPEGAPAPDAAELERLLALDPLVLVASRATRGVMVLTAHRRGPHGIEAVAVQLEDADGAV